MESTLFPTKGNLIIAKSTLALSRQGYDLLDKKRNILTREMMTLIDKAKTIQSQINDAFTTAYRALEKANIVMGIGNLKEIGYAISEEVDVEVHFTSVMGVEIPKVKYNRKPGQPAYGFFRTSSALDDAYLKFNKVRELTIELAEVDNAVYRLAVNIKKTQKRANALKNITIPRYLETVRIIQNVLEEKEREEFTRLKVIKRQKEAE